MYTLSAFALVLSLWAAWHASDRPSVRAFAALGVANGFAVLAHATNVLFAAVALAAVVLAWRERRSGPCGRGTRKWT